MFFSLQFCPLFLKFLIWPMLLSKVTYNWDTRKTIPAMPVSLKMAVAWIWLDAVTPNIHQIWPQGLHQHLCGRFSVAISYTPNPVIWALPSRLGANRIGLNRIAFCGPQFCIAGTFIRWIIMLWGMLPQCRMEWSDDLLTKLILLGIWHVWVILCG